VQAVLGEQVLGRVQDLLDAVGPLIGFAAEDLFFGGLTIAS
jgi:hypothetical protein